MAEKFRDGGFTRIAKRRMLLLHVLKRAETGAANVLDPAMAAHYRDQIDLAEGRLRGAGVCMRCGRKLQDPASKDRGYGADCARQIESERE